ncbi:hypothetical protein DFH06DRAFT_1184728 [Mycena polygramma]|nr:hypothetical protein DFH06DRAFT_1184728 [Mycena polygramma]
MAMNATSPLSSLPLGVDISPFADPVFAGVMLSTILWGITIVQTWNYYDSNNDGWMLRTFVGVLFILDTVTTVLTTEMGHIYLIQNFGSLATLTTLPFSGVLEVALNVIIVFFVQLFFASRVYLLTERRVIVPGIIVLFAVAALIAGMFIVTDINTTRTVAALAKPSMKLEVILTNSFEAAADVVATVAMSWQFYSSRGYIKSTNSLLDKLLGYAVGRGALVTVTQLLTLALYVADPTKLNWMPVHFSIGKISHITTITILNSRQAMRRPTHSSFTNDSMFSDTFISANRPAAATPLQLRSMDPSRAENKTGVHIRHEQTIDYDDEPPKHRMGGPLQFA